MNFADPLWLAALAVPPVVMLIQSRRKLPSLRFPSVDGLDEAARRSGRWLLNVPVWLRLLALCIVIAALARPQCSGEPGKLRKEGIDIVLVIDVSTSMLAEDFELRGRRHNRLEVVKEVVREFIEARPDDRIGLVVFAGRAYTQSPLTLDHAWLSEQLAHIDIGMVEDGTAIGEGMATGLNRLRRSSAKSRVMVLLTDGVNNAGTITPQMATELAKSLGVRIYTVGAGTKGPVPFPATDVFGRKVYQQVTIEVDDEGLSRIADATGARYFRATDTESLRQVYRAIDRMEKTSFEQPQAIEYEEQFPWLVITAALLLLLEWVLRGTRLRLLP